MQDHYKCRIWKWEHKSVDYDVYIIVDRLCTDYVEIMTDYVDIVDRERREANAPYIYGAFVSLLSLHAEGLKEETVFSQTQAPLWQSFLTEEQRGAAKLGVSPHVRLMSGSYVASYLELLVRYS